MSEGTGIDVIKTMQDGILNYGLLRCVRIMKCRACGATTDGPEIGLDD